METKELLLSAHIISLTLILGYQSAEFYSKEQAFKKDTLSAFMVPISLFLCLGFGLYVHWNAATLTAIILSLIGIALGRFLHSNFGYVRIMMIIFIVFVPTSSFLIKLL